MSDKTSYFSFGHNHRHEISGRVFDHNTIARIKAPDPRAVMLAVFGRRWSFEYADKPDHPLMRDLPIIDVSIDMAEQDEEPSDDWAVISAHLGQVFYCLANQSAERDPGGHLDAHLEAAKREGLSSLEAIIYVERWRAIEELSDKTQGWKDRFDDNASALLDRLYVSFDERVDREAGLRLALERCVELSGADTSDGMPTDQPLHEWAVECVRVLREEHDELLSEIQIQREALSKRLEAERSGRAL